MIRVTRERREKYLYPSIKTGMQERGPHDVLRVEIRLIEAARPAGTLRYEELWRSHEGGVTILDEEVFSERLVVELKETLVRGDQVVIDIIDWPDSEEERSQVGIGFWVR